MRKVFQKHGSAGVLRGSIDDADESELVRTMFAESLVKRPRRHEWGLPTRPSGFAAENILMK